MRNGTVIWPDADTYAAVNEIRAYYDAHYQLIGPHITVAFPAVVDAPLEEVCATMNEIAAHTKPFTIHIGRWASAPDLLAFHPEATRFLIERYPNARNLVVLLPDAGQEELLALRHACHAAIPQPPLLMDYPLYMTLGQTLSDEGLAQARQKLASYRPDYRFQVTSFDLLTEQPDGSWVTVQTFPLTDEL